MKNVLNVIGTFFVSTFGWLDKIEGDKPILTNDTLTNPDADNEATSVGTVRETVATYVGAAVVVFTVLTGFTMFAIMKNKRITARVRSYRTKARQRRTVRRAARKARRTPAQQRATSKWLKSMKK
jgi:hypothetical protein